MAQKRASLHKRREYMRKYYASPKGRLHRLKQRGAKTTTDEINRLLAQGQCEICGKRTDLAIDHDHETGKLRGLLCRPCNSALGFLKDSTVLALRAVDYLLRWEASK